MGTGGQVKVPQSVYHNVFWERALHPNHVELHHKEPGRIYYQHCPHTHRCGISAAVRHLNRLTVALPATLRTPPPNPLATVTAPSCVLVPLHPSPCPPPAEAPPKEEYQVDAATMEPLFEGFLEAAYGFLGERGWRQAPERAACPGPLESQ